MSGLHDASWVERAIREAQERGEFDNLPGAGKPLREIDTNDPNWWLKSYAEREGLDLGDALPPPLLLRREAAGYPESLVDMADEAKVREVLLDYNTRARAEILRPFAGRGAPPLVKYLDVDEVVAKWRELRAARAKDVAAQPVSGHTANEPDAAHDPSAGQAGSRRGWLRRRFGGQRGGRSDGP